MRLDLSSFFAVGALSLAVSAHPLTRRQQPEAVDTPKLDLEPLSWGDVSFIQTTDTHGKKEKHTHSEFVFIAYISICFRLACCKYLHLCAQCMRATRCPDWIVAVD